MTDVIQTLKERALRLKPTVEGVIATVRGWEKVNLRGGTNELLVSFHGLEALISDEVTKSEEKIESLFESKVEAPVAAVGTKVESIEQTTISTVEAPVVAVEGIVKATEADAEKVKSEVEAPVAATEAVVTKVEETVAHAEAEAKVVESEVATAV